MKSRFLPAIYFFAVAAECFANLNGNLRLQFVTKPSLMMILIVYFARETRIESKLKYLICAALAFSWLGDVVLLLDKTYKNLFVYGLLAFLVAHIFHIFYFVKIAAFNRAGKSPKILAALAVAIYLTVFYANLYPHLGDLKIPVFIYGAVISLMLLMSLRAFDDAGRSYAKISIAGAILFVASDSILAVNRFIAPFAFASILIMLTYALGQFLIAEGSLRNLRAIEKRI